MVKKLFIFLIILAIIFSGISLGERYRVEKANKNTELIFDNKALNSLEEKNSGISYSKLADNGVTGIAIYEETISRLVKESKVKLIKGNELERRALISGVSKEFSRFDYDQDSAFLLFSGSDMVQKGLEYRSIWQDEGETAVQFYRYQANNLQPGNDQATDSGVESTVETTKETTVETTKETTEVTAEKEDRLLMFFPEWKDSYINFSLGFDEELIDQIKSAGLMVIPRIENKKGNDGTSLNTDWKLMKELSPEFMIFAGDEVSGYPEQIAKTAQIMKENKINLGMIEAFIGYQKGVDSLARRMNFDLMRVHSIQQGEMEKYSERKVIDRYLRAVRERNVRLLYLKPFLDGKNGMSSRELNIDYLNKLRSGLNRMGYKIGEARPFAQFWNSNWFLLIISIGIFAAGIILLEKLINIRLGGWRVVLLLLAVGVSIGLIVIDKNMFFRKILALGSSVIFPSLAVIIGVFEGEENWFKSFLQVVGISFAGVLLLAGNLSHISFVLKIDQFRGVKLAFLLPLMVIAFYYWYHYIFDRGTNYVEYVQDLLNKNIKVKHILLASFIGLVGVVYIARSGNYSFLPMLELESSFRELLEDILLVRPRFKAFLIGHPFLVVTIYYWDKIKSHLVGLPLAVLAGVGQITVANTFAHVHIPLVISLLRTFHGYWLGLVVGLILIAVINFLNRLRVKYL